MDFIEVYFCELSNELYDNKLLTLISNDKRESLKSRHMMDTKLHIYSDLFVRCFICNKYHLYNHELEFSKNKYCKPYLLNDLNIFYNISHTNNAFVVAFSKEEVGIDIEKIRTIELNIANRFFSLPEQEYIFSKKNKTKAFFEIWTKKESYIKYTGQNIFQLPLINVFNKDIHNLIHTITFHNYVISICSTYNSSQNTLNIIQIRENDFEMQIKKLFNYKPIDIN